MEEPDEDPVRVSRRLRAQAVQARRELRMTLARWRQVQARTRELSATMRATIEPTAKGNIPHRVYPPVPLVEHPGAWTLRVPSSGAEPERPGASLPGRRRPRCPPAPAGAPG